ncbi:MAG: endonuclease V [Candidatus Omnitrophica bacterium]|nr:endonuclease V [Candidatus Omnitrophota bacterium]
MFRFQDLHPWEVSPKEAVQIQKRLRERVIRRDEFGKILLVAGCDTAFDLEKNEAHGGVIVYRWPALEEVERKSAVKAVTFPYIPGLLAFREIPVLLEAISALECEPDLFLFDGHGISHPRGMGIASHIGILLDKPTIGCAKSLLYGRHEEPGSKKGSFSPLLSKDGSTIGRVLRTRDGVRPIFVSIGHKTNLETATQVTLQCCDGYRIPKPTREADHFVEQCKRGKV